MGSTPSGRRGRPGQRGRHPWARARRLTVALAAALALMGAAAAAPGASAQQLPPPPEDNPLAPLAPTLGQVCGLANSAVSLIPLAAGLFPGAEVPPELTQLLGPLTTVCAYVPTPATRRECAIDTDVYQALNPLATALTGQGLLLDPTVAARLADQLAALEALLPGLGGSASALLDGIASCSIPAPVEPPAVPPATAPSVTLGSTPAVDPGPGSSSLGPLPSPAMPPSGGPEQAAPPVPVRVTSAPAVDHLRHRVMLLAPLLVLGAALGLRSLRAPLAGAAGARRRSRGDGTAR